MDDCEMCFGRRGKHYWKHHVVCEDCYQELMEAEKAGTCQTCYYFKWMYGTNCPYGYKSKGGHCSHFESDLEHTIGTY